MDDTTTRKTASSAHGTKKKSVSSAFVRMVGRVGSDLSSPETIVCLDIHPTFKWLEHVKRSRLNQPALFSSKVQQFWDQITHSHTMRDSEITSICRVQNASILSWTRMLLTKVAPMLAVV